MSQNEALKNQMIFILGNQALIRTALPQSFNNVQSILLIEEYLYEHPEDKLSDAILSIEFSDILRDRRDVFEEFRTRIFQYDAEMSRYQR